LVGVAVEGGVGVAVEVNSETDFVAKNADFQAMVSGITQTATGTSTIDELKAAQMDGKSVEDYIVAKVATIGENMSVRRMARVEGEAVAAYVHNAAAEGMGQARESGKPDNVIEKMIVGRMNKYFEEVTLLNQKFVMNPDLTVAKAAEEAGVSISSYARKTMGG